MMIFNKQNHYFELYQEISIFHIAQTKYTKTLKAFCFVIHTSNVFIATMQDCKCQKSEAAIWF